MLELSEFSEVFQANARHVRDLVFREQLLA